MSDIISGVNVRVSLLSAVAEDGVYYGETLDLSDPIARLSFLIGVLSHSNGAYTLTLEDSDDELSWSPVPDSKIIGSASAIAVTGSSLLPGLGVFGTRRYVRPVLTATGIPPATETVGLDSITYVGTTATATFSAPEGLEDGDEVVISGANEPEYNGTFIASNLVGDSFDYTMDSEPSGNATGTLLAEIPVHPTPVGASIIIFSKQQTEGFGDMDSDTKSKALFFTSFGADGEYISNSYYVGDWEGGIGAFLWAGGLIDGTYTLKFDESDDDGVLDPWTEVPSDNVLVGEAVIDYDCQTPVALPTSGVFDTKSYIRLRLVATNVTSGVYIIVGVGIFASDILPTDSI